MAPKVLKERKNLLMEVLRKTKQPNGEEATRYWLAKETGLNYVTLSSYFYGRSEPNLNTLFDLAEVLKVNPKELINS